MQRFLNFFQTDQECELDSLSKTNLKKRGIVADAVVSRDGQTTDTYWYFICFNNKKSAVAALTKMKQAVGDADKVFSNKGCVTEDKLNYPNNPYRIRVSSEQMQAILKAMPVLENNQTPQNQ